MGRKVEVVTAQKEWAEQFVQEKQLLLAVFLNEVIAIHHIGSTAIKGMKAKPIIDILIVVKDIENIEKYNLAMEKIGYNHLGENGIPKRRFFIKGEEKRSHHVHVFQEGNPEIERHLTFRDFMNRHPQEAEAYGRLKMELAKRFSEDIQSYISGKDTFIKDIDQRAMAWRNKINEQ